MSKSSKLFFILVKKELIQFRRNAFLPKLLIILPVMLMLVMPFVATMDVRNITITIIDEDNSSISKRIASHIASSEYFIYHDEVKDYHQALTLLDNGDIDVIVSIPKNFESRLQQGVQDPISIVANAVNATKAGQGMQYAIQTIGKSIKEIQVERGAAFMNDLIVVENRYNPTNNYKYFMIPALMIMLVILLCCFLPALNIVSEKESGTIEQLNVSPIKPLQFTLSKLLPYWIMGLVEIGVAMLIAYLVYGLAPQGSIGVIYLAAFLFIICMSAFGVTMANISNTLQQTIYVMFFFVMIFMLMSGLMTPVSSMPKIFQYITCVFPPRYFIEIMRAVYLKGTTLAELSSSLLALLVMAVALCVVASRTYKKQN